eukprot:scaffold137876_cov15-Tisochrysis_lutea.AAC.1
MSEIQGSSLFTHGLIAIIKGKKVRPGLSSPLAHATQKEQTRSGLSSTHRQLLDDLVALDHLRLSLLGALFMPCTITQVYNTAAVEMVTQLTQTVHSNSITREKMFHLVTQTPLGCAPCLNTQQLPIVLAGTEATGSSSTETNRRQQLGTAAAAASTAATQPLQQQQQQLAHLLIPPAGLHIGLLVV